MDFQGTVLLSYIDSNGKSQTFSNIKEIDTMYGQDWQAGVPTITVQQFKSPYTEKLTRLMLNIDLAGVKPQTVRKIQVMSTFKYRLREKLNLDMIGMLEAVIETPDGAGRLLIDGNLVFEQEEAILIDNVMRTLFDSDPLMTDYETQSINEMIENY